ncbi:tetrahydrofolate dehydrogenase/cyclohydrolase catalytic domain-containing protein, partial [Ileibacterium valens]
MIIYGSELSSRLKSEMAAEVEALKKEGRRVPGLSVILVGDNPASQSYV